MENAMRPIMIATVLAVAFAGSSAFAQSTYVAARRGRVSRGCDRSLMRRLRSKFLRWRISFSENRYPLFRDMR